jgi:hypothetical protein
MNVLWLQVFQNSKHQILKVVIFISEKTPFLFTLKITQVEVLTICFYKVIVQKHLNLALLRYIKLIKQLKVAFFGQRKIHIMLPSVFKILTNLDLEFRQQRMEIIKLIQCEHELIE